MHQSKSFLNYASPITTFSPHRIRRLSSYYTDPEFPIHCIIGQVVNIRPSTGVWSPTLCRNIADKLNQWADQGSPKIVANFSKTSSSEQPLQVKLHELRDINGRKPFLYDLVHSGILESD